MSDQKISDFTGQPITNPEDHVRVLIPDYPGFDGVGYFTLDAALGELAGLEKARIVHVTLRFAAGRKARLAVSVEALDKLTTRPMADILTSLTHGRGRMG